MEPELSGQQLDDLGLYLAGSPKGRAQQGREVMSVRPYLIDITLIGSLVVRATNSGAAAAQAGEYLRRTLESITSACIDTELAISEPIDLRAKMGNKP